MKAVFIIGFWNSGTTLLTDILRKHPDLALRHARFKPNLEDRGFVKLLRKFNADFISFQPYYEKVVEHGFDHYPNFAFAEDERVAFRKAFWKKYSGWTRAKLLLKNPWLFFLHPFLMEMFEKDNAKYICILRNGQSQVVSKDYWKGPKEQNPEKHLLGRSLFWAKCMDLFFDTWSKEPKCLTLRYENLCAYPEETISKVCNFLGISIDKMQAHIPNALESRNTKWNALEETLQIKVNRHIEEAQKKLDEHYPVK